MRGFTFVELLLVIGIMMTLVGMSSGLYSRFLVQNSVITTQDQLVASFRKAQMYAMTGKANSAWAVKYATGTITLFAVTASGYDETFSVNPNIQINGFSTITFARMTGLPDSSPTINISGNGQTASTNVNSQGVVSRL